METMRTVLAALAVSGRVVLRRGPAMAACLVGGQAMRFPFSRGAFAATAWRNPEWLGPVIAVLLLAIDLLIFFVSVIAAFWVARPELTHVQALARLRRQADELPAAGEEAAMSERPTEGWRGFLGATSTAVLPVAALLVAWGLVQGNVAELAARSRAQGVSNPTADPRFVLPYAVAGVMLFLASKWGERRFQRTGRRPAQVVFIVAEACYIFIALFGVSQLLGALADWWGRRAVVVAVHGWIMSALDALPELVRRPVTEFFDPGLTSRFQGVTFGLAVLGVACIVYSYELHRRHRGLLEDLVRVAPGSTSLQRSVTLRRLARPIGEEIGEKWGAIVDAARLLMSQSVLLLLAFAVISMLFRVVVGQLQLAAYWLAGSEVTPGVVSRIDAIALVAALVVQVGVWSLAAGMYDTLIARLTEQAPEDPLPLGTQAPGAPPAPPAPKGGTPVGE